MIKIYRMLLAIVILFTVAFNANAMVFFRDGDVLVMNGKIQPGDFEKFMSFSHGAKQVVVNSTGGDGITALKIALQIEAAKMRIRVSGFCVSACSQILFVAGYPREIEKGAFLIFHEGEFGALVSAISSFLKLSNADKTTPLNQAVFTHPEFRLVEELITALEQLYQRKGVSIQGMRNVFKITAQHGEYLNSEIIDGKLIHKFESNAARRCDLWEPDVVALSEIGIKVVEPFFHYVGANPNQKVYVGSVFDIARIKSECGVTLTEADLVNSPG